MSLKCIGAVLMICMAWGCGGGVKSKDEIMKMAASESPYERELAVYEMIRQYNYTDYFNPLSNLMLDIDVSVRRGNMRNIAQTKDARFIPLLQQLAGNSDPDDRQLATDAIAALKKFEKKP